MTTAATGPGKASGLTDLNASTPTGFSLNRVTNADGVERLVLYDLLDPSLSPLSVDFTSAALTHRLSHGFGRNQSIGRAIGLRAGEAAPFVIDATAGLGTDTLVMAALGCRVRAIERSETIFALLEDGKTRLEEKAIDDPSFLPLSQRFSFEHGDARSIILSLSEAERPDVIYLDPMYPEEGRSKSALPKKSMQIFRRLLEGDLDADDLFSAAISRARKRVVVKRPLKAPHLASSRPTHIFEGKTARFDLYLTRA